MGSLGLPGRSVALQFEAPDTPTLSVERSSACSLDSHSASQMFLCCQTPPTPTAHLFLLPVHTFIKINVHHLHLLPGVTSTHSSSTNAV